MIGVGAFGDLCHPRDLMLQVFAVLEKPAEALAEGGEFLDMARLQDFHRDERDQADHRTDSEREGGPARLELVVVEAVFVVP